MDIQLVISGIIGLALLYGIVKLIKLPIKIIVKLLVNGVLGLVTLTIVNAIGVDFGITVGINIFTSLVAGFFGIPGVIAIIIITLFI